MCAQGWDFIGGKRFWSDLIRKRGLWIWGLHPAHLCSILTICRTPLDILRGPRKS